MLKQSPPTGNQLEMVSMEDLVPKDHLLRKIDRYIDFEFIRDEVAHLYCKDNGRPSIDPVRLFKIIFIGYLFGIKSERQLVKEIEVNVAYRWFLQMSLTEKVIHASTLSQNRIRRFNGTDIFEKIFVRIVEQAMQKGLVAGEVLYTDSTHLKASANKNKHHSEFREAQTSAYMEMLNADINKDRIAHGKKPLSAPKNCKIKSTKVSDTDPESGFMARDNKPQGFFYLDHRTVDSKHNIILDTYTTPGNVNDSQPYISRLDKTLERFKLKPFAAGLDSAYGTATIAECLLRRDILPVFAYRRPVKTQNVFKKKDFIYNEITDTYICPNEQVLEYVTTSRTGYREYRSCAKLCASCPLKSNCTMSKNNTKSVTRHIYSDSLESAHKIRLSSYGKRTYKRRSETVERSFADAKQHHGHRYARFRGLDKVQMQCLLAATAQNMKKIALVLSRLFLFCELFTKKPIKSFFTRIFPRRFNGKNKLVA